MNLTTKYMAIFSIFLFGVLVVAMGSKSEAQLVILGQTFPVFALTRAVGLLLMLGSIITTLAVYGNSLPLTRPEIEGRVRSRAGQAQPAPERAAKNRSGAHEVPVIDKQSERPSVQLGRVSTDARLRLIVAQKRAKADDERLTRTVQAA